jgi:hypothetical protein
VNRLTWRTIVSAGFCGVMVGWMLNASGTDVWILPMLGCISVGLILAIGP